MSEPVVLYEKRGNVGIFTLNRPKAMNAVSHEVSQTFEKLMDDFEADENVWVGIVRSSHPKVFCAGADLKSVSRGKKVSTAKGGFAGFVQYPRTKPMIACVDGAALAGGCEIVLSCDLIVASDASRFGLPEVKRSLIPAAGGMLRLPKKLPYSLAMELILTGDPMPAAKLHQHGMVNVLCPKGQSEQAALDLAARLAVNAPLAVREARRVVIDNLTTSEADGFKDSTKGMASLISTPDFSEGPKAFIEKRAPRWTGKRSKL
eukprot:TRINITY_DN2606_c1_g2_i1.p1 TRINITY_DN2606_c1_g2~~TRINITY_DN2606_c1_g2_i1.p1  ORF type:complete len:279 (+),score=84.51 TRINITY_DN2606_c1_g2_i1:56-838(+)